MRHSKKIILIALLVFVVCLFPQLSEAQCVMCKAVAEDSANSGGIGRGINSGIIYIMGIPYLIMVVAYFAFFRKKGTFNN